MRKKMIVVLCILAGCLLVLGLVAFGGNFSASGDSSDDGTTSSSSEDASELGSNEEDSSDAETLRVTISSVGDCSLGKLQIHGYDGSFNSYYDTYGADYFLQNVRDIFAADDMTVANFEGVLSTSDAAVEKEFNIEGFPEYTSILTGSSVEVVGTGNNHILDYGEDGALDTWNALDAAGIPYAYNEKTVLYTTESGIRIGITASCVLAEYRMQYLLDGIEELRDEGADIIIAMPHWGVEREHYANETQVNFAHQLIDAGADVVLGSHPHVLQGFEIYNGKMIAYSQGNFCYGGHHNPSDKETMIYQQTFTFIDGELQPTAEVHIIPCYISSTQSMNDFCPTPATGDDATEILSHLNAYSEGYSAFSLDDHGDFYWEE